MNIKIPYTYLTAYNFKEGISGVQLKDKWGFINVEGNVVIPFKYDKLTDYYQFMSEGMIGVMNGKYCGFINKMGEKPSH